MLYTQPRILNDLSAAGVIASTGMPKGKIGPDHPGGIPSNLQTNPAYEADE
jgi:hypothetical protein